MKVSLVLTFVALWSSFVAGFSCPPNHHCVTVTRFPSRTKKGCAPSSVLLGYFNADSNARRSPLSSSSLSSPSSLAAAATTKTTSTRPFRATTRMMMMVSPPSSSSSTLLRNQDSSSSSSQCRIAVGLPRGGGGAGSSSSSSSSTKTYATKTPYDTGTKCPATGAVTVLASLWGTGGVVYILAKAIKRVIPIALEPFQGASSSLRPLSQFELGAYIVTCLWFAYVEGYKGFQQKFSPLVVKRSFTLIPGRNGTRWYHYFLAPLYSMGMMHATRKRQIVSWSVSLGIAAIVAAVKRLPYPWRNIVDAGVVVGLSWGSLSIVLFYIKSWITGQPPPGIDAALPDYIVGKKDSSKDTK